MTNALELEKIVELIPEDLSLACSGVLLEKDNESIRIKLRTKNNILVGPCECFSLTSFGIVYLKANIETVEDGIVTLKNFSNYEVMQRREYSRINIDDDVILKNQEGFVFLVKAIDISAGGMKILSSLDLLLNSDYYFEIKLNNNLNLSGIYSPIKKDKKSNGQYQISGKFKNISNKEKFSLVQYCFTKQMENINK